MIWNWYQACYAALVRVFALNAYRDKATDGLAPAHLAVVGLMLSPVVGRRQDARYRTLEHFGILA